MADTRRGRGEGGLYWDEGKQRWVASLSVGFGPDGKRRRIKASAVTKTAAREKLRELALKEEARAKETIQDSDVTVAQAVESWLHQALADKARSTREGYASTAKHIITDRDGIGHILVQDLRVRDVQQLLTRLAPRLSSRSLKIVLHIVRHSLDQAEADELVMRNVARNKAIVVPKGRPGRPSKSLTLAQAITLLETAQASATMIGTMTVVSLLSGVRTEEIRALLWEDVDLEAGTVAVYRSARTGDDTKTEKSRRRLKLPQLALQALVIHKERQHFQRLYAGSAWQEHDLVFTSAIGTGLDRWHVRREFRKFCAAAGVTGDWTPRELRHSFVSILSDADVSLSDIADLVGHSGTSVTETVYRHQLKPTLTRGAEVFDRLFRPEDELGTPQGCLRLPGAGGLRPSDRLPGTEHIRGKYGGRSRVRTSDPSLVRRHGPNAVANSENAGDTNLRTLKARGH